MQNGLRVMPEIIKTEGVWDKSSQQSEKVDGDTFFNAGVPAYWIEIMSPLAAHRVSSGAKSFILRRPPACNKLQLLK